MSSKEHENIAKLEEPFAVYLRGVAKDELQISISKIATIAQLFANRMLIVHAIRKGIPHSLFSLIAAATPFTESDWSDFLNVSSKTLQRYKKDGNHVFKPIHSEKIIELAEVTSIGQEVFDSNEQFYAWLITPTMALAGMKPAELLKDSYGKEMVLNELNRIDQGIFA